MIASSDSQNIGTHSESRKDHLVVISSWLIVVWMCYVFLGSLPYKFSNHPDTQHIFSTIGGWLQGILGDTIGELFTQYGAYLVGSFELLTSLLLLSPIVLWMGYRSREDNGGVFRRVRARLHAIGGLLASMVMAGAVFFHLFTPLGVDVLHEGQSDGGSLFRAALSILVLGIVLLVMNRRRGYPTEIL